MHSPMAHDTTTVVPDKKKDTPLEGGHSTKISAMWNLKHEIRSPKFYELLIKTELKGDTAMYLKNFYNHIKMCLSETTIPQEELIPGHQSINGHSYFSE